MSTTSGTINDPSSTEDFIKDPGRGSYYRWDLYKGEILLGRLTQIEENSPAITCHFSPTEQYGIVETLFQDLCQLSDVTVQDVKNKEKYKRITEEITELSKEIFSLNISLHPVEKSSTLNGNNAVLLYITGNRAYLRPGGIPTVKYFSK